MYKCKKIMFIRTNPSSIACEIKGELSISFEKGDPGDDFRDNENGNLYRYPVSNQQGIKVEGCQGDLNEGNRHIELILNSRMMSLNRFVV